MHMLKRWCAGMTTHNMMELLCVLFVAVGCIVSDSYQLPDVSGRTYNDVFDLPGFIFDVTGEEVIVTLNSGTLSGRRRTGDPRAGGAILTVDWFQGIPYAKPPVGPLRFKRPVPAAPWSGVKSASKFSSVCPQPDGYRFASSSYRDEDCLYLNVYSPNQQSDSEDPYPVMVYIHGGSNLYGAGSIHYGHLLAQHGVVIVTFNYRLGVLGFLCGEDKALEGNYGLHDQILLLKWVQENIQQFRGDPKQVTIFGNSAGGEDVGLLAMAPPAKGLFKYVVVQSGSPLAFRAFHDPRLNNVTEQAFEVGAAYDCENASIDEMVECLRKCHWKKFTTIPEGKLSRRSVSGHHFMPCIDHYLFNDYPRKIMESSSSVINPEAIMTGVTRDEWASFMGWFIEHLYEESPFLDRDYTDGLDRDTFKQAIRHVVTVHLKWPVSLVKLFINEYTTWEKQYDPLENRQQYIHFLTDYAMLAPTVLLAEEMTKKNVTSYLYSFNHETEHTSRKWQKSFHSMDINFLFGSPFTGLNVNFGTSQKYYEVDRDMSRQMMIWWTNFAKYGTPNGLDVPVSEWKQFHPDTADYMAMTSNNSESRTQNRYDKVRLWNHVIPDILDQMNYKETSDDSSATLWILVALCSLLTVLLITSAFCFIFKDRICSAQYSVTKTDE